VKYRGNKIGLDKRTNAEDEPENLITPSPKVSVAKRRRHNKRIRSSALEETVRHVVTWNLVICWRNRIWKVLQ